MVGACELRQKGRRGRFRSVAAGVCWWRCKIETIEIDDEDGGGRFAGNSGRQQGGFGGVNADRLGSPHLTSILPRLISSSRRHLRRQRGPARVPGLQGTTPRRGTRSASSRSGFSLPQKLPVGFVLKRARGN
ncbi:hypothetical protein ACMD2_09258 [Ananas comosus]|uniref:Uncharacterized protein n=1 Tax=Ananas comosus TaxID=4615 RepID=A0A199URL9_ANACO|nr:hypothetical protein ACMD2_09258 [Ananas comosus]